jgi:hypothetical protein
MLTCLFNYKFAKYEDKHLKIRLKSLYLFHKNKKRVLKKHTDLFSKTKNNL